MLTTLSSLDDNLSGIYKKKKKNAKEKNLRKKIKSVCNFIRPKNNKFFRNAKNVKKEVKTNKWVIQKISKHVLIL